MEMSCDVAIRKHLGELLAFELNPAKMDSMSTASELPLENLSLAEKLLLMERLWGELSRRPSDIPSPDWHGDILSQRAKAVQDGRTAFQDWEAAKQRLRDRSK